MRIITSFCHVAQAVSIERNKGIQKANFPNLEEAIRRDISPVLMHINCLSVHGVRNPSRTHAFANQKPLRIPPSVRIRRR